jgi:hypothetical protein
VTQCRAPMSSCAPLPAPAARNLALRAVTRRRRDGWLIVIRARYALCGTAERGGHCSPAATEPDCNALTNRVASGPGFRFRAAWKTARRPAARRPAGLRWPFRSACEVSS